MLEEIFLEGVNLLREFFSSSERANPVIPSNDQTSDKSKTPPACQLSISYSMKVKSSFVLMEIVLENLDWLIGLCKLVHLFNFVHILRVSCCWTLQKSWTFPKLFFTIDTSLFYSFKAAKIKFNAIQKLSLWCHISQTQEERDSHCAQG